MPKQTKKQNKRIIAQGAEAILIRQGTILKKDRIKKSYRHKNLDTFLRASRTRHESRIMDKASKLILIPKILKTTEHEIDMDFIEGEKLSNYLDKMPESKAIKVCRTIGQQVSKLHQANIIHGDLTTSNMIWINKTKGSAKLKLKRIKPQDKLHTNSKLYFIDFGLSFHSPRVEDKAVDLHLIKQAIESKHFKKSNIYMKNIITGYKESNPQSSQILKQLEKVESRGRYKGKH